MDNPVTLPNTVPSGSGGSELEMEEEQGSSLLKTQQLGRKLGHKMSADRASPYPQKKSPGRAPSKRSVRPNTTIKLYTGSSHNFKSDVDQRRVPRRRLSAIQREHNAMQRAQHRSNTLLLALEQHHAAIVLQRSVRKFLSQNKLITVQRAHVVIWVKKMTRIEAGFNRLFSFLLIVCFYFEISFRRFAPSFSFSVNSSLRSMIENTRFEHEFYNGESGLTREPRGLDLVDSPGSLLKWILSYYVQSYNTNLISSPCNICGLPEELLTVQICGTKSFMTQNQTACTANIADSMSALCSSSECTDFDGTANYTITAKDILSLHGGQGTINCSLYSSFFDTGITATQAEMLMGQATSEEGKSGTEYSNDWGYNNRLGNMNHLLLGSILVVIQNYEKLEACLEGDAISYSQCYSTSDVQKDNLDLSDTDGFFYGAPQVEFSEIAGGYAMILNIERMSLIPGLCFLKAQEENGNFFGENTKSVKVLTPIYNGQKTSGYGYSEVAVNFDLGGLVSTEVSAQTFPLRNLYTSDSTDQTRMILEICFSTLLLAYMGYEAAMVLKKKKATLKRFPLRLKQSGLSQTLQSLKIVQPQGMSYLCYSLLIVQILLWLLWDTIVQAEQEKNTRLFKYLNGDTVTVSTIPELIDLIYSFCAAIVQLAVLWRWMKILVVISCFLSLYKIFALSQFNARLAIVGDTLKAVFWRLFHFALMFLLILVFFSLTCALVFGSDIEDFAGVQNSLNTFINFSFGGFGDPEQFAAIQDRAGALAPAVVLLFLLLEATLMFNLLVAILLEGYAASRAAEAEEETITMAFCLYLARLAGRTTQGLVRLCRCRYNWCHKLKHRPVTTEETGGGLTTLSMGEGELENGEASSASLDGKGGAAMGSPVLKGNDPRRDRGARALLTLKEARAVLRSSPLPGYFADMVVRRALLDALRAREEGGRGEEAGRGGVTF